MNQCMQMAEYLSIPSASLKRKPSNEHIDHGSKRRAMSDYLAQPPAPTDSFEHQAALPTAPPPVAILPRPPNGSAESPPSQPPAAAAAVPKKRGRPSRADKAKRDLRPLLPQHLAPRPPPQALGPNTPRPILPAVSPGLDQRPITPPTAYSASSASDGLRGRKRVRPSSADEQRPSSRGLSIKADPTIAAQRSLTEDFPRERLPRPHGPVPLEPDPRVGVRQQAPPEGLPTTLPALVEKDVATARMESNHEARAFLANSA